MSEKASAAWAGLESPLLTDLYQLTMLQGYFDAGMMDEAVFELFVRKLPPQRNFLLLAGLEQALAYLENLRFAAEDLACLERTRLFTPEFLHFLEGLSFAGEVHAMPEGTVFFANEPVLRVTAPLPVAQLVESRIINIVHFQTLIASKAARCVLAAPKAQLVDFGMRRAHGGEAALWAARASFIAGFAGTSNVLANREFGIPVFGTMAHSFVQAHDSEMDAFRRFCESHKGAVVLLIDTYDTERGAERVAALARELPPGTIHSVRLDSGDLGALAKRVRQILDGAGCSDIGIFASGNLDELRLCDLIAETAPIDGFGVGTSLDISADCPSLDFVYKLEEYAGTPRRKRSPGKATWPGRKQVYRERDATRHLLQDSLTVENEQLEGEPLLEQLVAGGRRLGPLPPLSQIREHATRELETLTDGLRELRTRTAYGVDVSPALRALAAEVDSEFL